MKENMFGIVFVLTVDPNITSTVFADVGDHSYFNDKDMMIFSMNTIFRIVDIQRLDNEHRLFEVKLLLVGENDPEVCVIKNRIYQEVESSRGWKRLGDLLIRQSQLTEAEDFYHVLLQKSPTQPEQELYNHCIGLIKEQQADYQEALRYYEREISIKENSVSPVEYDSVNSYKNIALVYYDIREYSKALFYCNKSLGILEKHSPANRSDLATFYNCMGTIHYHLGDDSTALFFFNKSLDIRQEILPSNHPSLASCYSNLAVVYDNMNEYSKALFYYEKSLEIDQKDISPDHFLSLATSHNNIGGIRYEMKEYTKALMSFEKARDIFQDSLPSDYPDIQNVLKWINLLKKKNII